MMMSAKLNIELYCMHQFVLFISASVQIENGRGGRKRSFSWVPVQFFYFFGLRRVELKIDLILY